MRRPSGTRACLCATDATSTLVPPRIISRYARKGHDMLTELALARPERQRLRCDENVTPEFESW